MPFFLSLFSRRVFHVQPHARSDVKRLALHRLDQGRFRKLRRAIFNRAHLKTLYVTFQIVCSTSFTLDVTFPDIFVDYLEFLNVLTFDMFGTIR